jgi:hypothetical protein
MNNILIIGGPNTGKTHFGGQLFGRLQHRSGRYKIVSLAENLTIFKEVLDRLNEGKAAGHTHVSANHVLELEIVNQEGVHSRLSIPDYGGEQISAIVNTRKINSIWKEHLNKSDAWLLFIRPDQIELLEDIVSRGIPDVETLNKRNNDQVQRVQLSTAAFYVELLQMLLFAKKAGTQQRMTRPRITVALSCWDRISQQVGNAVPSLVLKEKLPALHHFLESNWSKESWSVIGLSSTEKTLSEKDVDEDFMRKGPEKFGYFITADGHKENDLTLTIASILGDKNVY